MEDILKKNKKIRHNGTKMCKVCGRELPIESYIMIYGKNRLHTCKECTKKSREKSLYESALQQYFSDESMHFKRKYKKIDSSRILRKNESGIDLIARDERFVKLLYYKDTWYSSYGRVVEYRDAVEYKQDGWNPAHYRRGMCGIGYSGMAVGAEGYYEKSYTKWKDMMQRCHDKEVHKKYKPEYADKCVCEEWQNYANFKLWYDEHHVFGNRIDLDKDILKPGNKEYSPETCVLIEHYINTIFERHASDNIYENEDGKYFIGSNRKKVYETYDEVFEFACNKKKERIEKVAEKNLGRIPKCAYDAMLRYDVEALIRRDVIAA